MRLLLPSGSQASATAAAEEENDPLAPFEAALVQLPENSAPGLSCIGAIKSGWARARALAAETNRAHGGRAAGELLAHFADRMLSLLFDFAARRSGLVALSADSARSVAKPLSADSGTNGKVQAATQAPSLDSARPVAKPLSADSGTDGKVQAATQAPSLDRATSPPGIALIALGSYARRELAPFSDLDFLLLHADDVPETQLATLVGNLLRPLWDSALQIGHAVRSRQECRRALEEIGSTASALETATAVLDSRLVCGNRAFAEALYDQDLPAFLRRFGLIFVEAKHEETLRRWQGQSVYHTQPHLKDSPGAMRDFQLAIWLDRAAQLSGRLPRLKDRKLVSPAAIEEARAGYERLLTFRVSLHSLCGRRQDVLDFAMQQAVAEDLKYQGTDQFSAAEELLRHYFRAATAVYRLAHTVTRRYQEERAIATEDVERLRRKPVDEDFVRIGDYLYAARSGVFNGEDWMEPAFRGFLHAARLGLSASQDIGEAIRARLPEMNDTLRSHREAAAHFVVLLCARNNVAQTLRSMRDVGLLGSYIPEFGEVEGLAINDVYHDFTVDEHTLCVVEAVDKLYQGAEPGSQFRQVVLNNLPRPYLLRLAALLHDLGKSRGAPGHGERGALMVPAIGERLHLHAADVRTLIFLVEEHLTLSKVSQRRDPGEGELLKILAQRIGSKERLDMLYLLAYCDAVSVGRGSFPQWKDALLEELYREILAKLPARHGYGEPLPAMVEPAPAPAAEQSGLEAGLLAWAKDESDRLLAVEHCARVPARYLVEVSLNEAILHLETLKRMRASGKEAATAVHVSGGLMGMWVVSTDRPKRFSQICGAFLGHGTSIISALAYTRSDAIILDHFRLAPGPDTKVVDEKYWARLAASVEDTLTGKEDFQKKIEAARRRISFAPRITRNLEPEVRVDNKLSDRFTVVDVICGDRIGLLYGLSRALGDLGCDIHFAKIATTQGVVTDVFYITEVGGEQVTDSEKVLNIRRLLKAVAADFQEAKR